jgi:hypothetical protein
MWRKRCRCKVTKEPCPSRCWPSDATAVHVDPSCARIPRIYQSLQLAWRANWKSLTASSSGKSESKAMNTSGRSISLVILNLKLTCDFRLNCIGGGAANGCRDLTAVYGLLTEAYVKLCLV